MWSKSKTTRNRLWAVAAGALLTWGADSLLAQNPQNGIGQPQTNNVWRSERATDRTVRLNYLPTNWSKVLHDLANQSGSTLVMLDVPPGKYSRQDWRKHSREDAVKILNRELEPEGFRIVIKDQFLTVMQIRRTRREYQRPIAPSQPQDTVEGFTTSETSPAPQEPARLNRLQSAVREQPRTLQTLRQAVQQDVRPVAFEETGDQTHADDSTSLLIQPRNVSALEIAKQIHGTFKKRSKLADQGPNGLPAFVVDHFNAEEGQPHQTLFTIEIDTQANELIVTGAKNVQTAIHGLVSRLDVNPLAQERPLKMVAGDGNLAQLSDRLKMPLAVIAQANAQQPPADGAPAPPENPQPAIDSPSPQRDANSFQTMPAAGQQPGATTAIDRLPGVLGNLRGDVTIQALDDLDLLILDGNERDVQQVLEVIQRIEELAIGSLPEIHLLQLQHVDSQSLAQLLNDVYEQLSDLRNDSAQQSQVSVQVVPVVTPNAVLILAPGNAMDAVLDLADELDQPIDPGHVVEVIRLEHAVAEDVVEILETFYEEQVGLGTRLKAIADPRTNSIVIQANPRDLSEIKGVVSKVDADSAGTVNQLKLFPLKSAVAQELAAFLTSAIQSASDPSASTVQQSTTGGFQNQGGPNQSARAVVLEFLTDDGLQLIRSGLLNNIVFNADPRTNTLMVSAPEASLPLIAELINILDRPSHTVASIKVFPLENADATDAVTLLQEIFSQDSQQSTGFGNQNNQTGALGIELLGAENSSSALIPLRFSSDPRTNSVVAIGGPEALQIVEAFLLRLDSNDARNRATTVIKLRNTSADDIALTINQFLASQRELSQLDPDRISTSQLLEQEVIVTSEPISNNLIISATPAYLDEIIELAERLDAEPSQVYIQALIVEVELDNTDEFGVELGFQDPILFDRSIINNILTITETVFDAQGNPTATNTRIVSQEADPGFNFNNQPFGNNNGPIAQPSRVGSQGLSNFALGRTNNDLGYGGLVLSASSDSVNVLIRALAARRTLRILSRPQILALDNQLAQIQVGQIVPVTDGVTINQAIVSPNILRDPAGIILTVTPRISPEGQIVMELSAEKSLYTTEGVTVFTDATTGAEITSPIKNITTALTTVKVPDGQTIVVGGMITKSEDTIERKVPWFGDLPLIGKAFRYDFYDERRTELLIFLTPRIVRCEADAELIKQIETDRMHFFLDEAESIHGPIFGVPGPIGFPGEYEFCPPEEPGIFEMGPEIPALPEEPGLIVPPPTDRSDISGPDNAARFQLTPPPEPAPVAQ